MQALSPVSLLAVGFGGFAGAILRYLIAWSTQSGWDMQSLPWGTIIANLAGCFMIGLLAGTANIREWADPVVRLFVFTGFLGGFTTFSTFSSETFLLIESQQIRLAILNVALQVIMGLLMVWIGYLSSRVFS